jgi:predicted DNA-binding transcriptional regulator AlpA
MSEKWLRGRMSTQTKASQIVYRKSTKVAKPDLCAKGQPPEGKQRLLDDRDAARRWRLLEAARRLREEQRERHLVTGPTLRALLDISAPTLWRWRKTPGFPRVLTINDRNYFVWAEILAWLDGQAGQSAASQKQ